MRQRVVIAEDNLPVGEQLRSLISWPDKQLGSTLTCLALALPVFGPPLLAGDDPLPSC